MGSTSRKISRTSGPQNTRAQGACAPVRNSYTMPELALAFGVPRSTVQGWVNRGLLGAPGGSPECRCLTCACVIQFIRTHPIEYDLSRVNRGWFIEMVFSGRVVSNG
jgi:hypothetical protein